MYNIVTHRRKVFTQKIGVIFLKNKFEVLGVVSKIGFWFKFEVTKNLTLGIYQVFKGLNFSANEEIGVKNNLETSLKNYFEKDFNPPLL